MMEAFTGFCTGMIDFPGKLAMTLFFNGCNLNCSFCHNKIVVRGEAVYSLKDIAHHLNRMQLAFHTQKVGIVLSGGEPTCHPEFHNAVRFFFGRPLALQSNGLVLPRNIRNPFESVILSLKPTSEVSIMPEQEYIGRLRCALEYYSSAKYRELRIVDFPKYKDDYGASLEKLSGDLLNRWTVKWVQPNKEV